jgi:C-terminal processing protease CtpA/Prc
MVGEPTFGKGVVQCAGEIVLTCEMIEVNGKHYHGTPIQPDINVRLSERGDQDISCLLRKALGT